MRNRRQQVDRRVVMSQQGFDICTVDSFEVRDLTRADEEFTNFAIHEDFPDLIPEREIWIDRRLFREEAVYYLANALVRLKVRRDGALEIAAYRAGLKMERQLRERLGGERYRNGRPHRRVPRRVYHSLYARIADPLAKIAVWFVQGNLVRSLYRTEYTEGGHGYVYRWVPKDQIWVEHDLDLPEIPFLVAHEYVELRLMRDHGLEYDPAHTIAAEVEFELRDGRGVTRVVMPKGQTFSRADLARLAAPDVFAEVEARFLKPRRKS
jgi:hypothetical protein